MTLDPGVVVAAIGALASGIGFAARLIYNDLKKDRDFWRDKFLQSADARDELLDVAEKKVAGA